MYRSFASRLSFCIALLVPLGLEVRADAIRMTVTGNAGFGAVNYSQVLTSDALADGYTSPPGTLGSSHVGASPDGPIDAPISLTIGLSDTAAPGSQGLTLSLSGSLTGQFVSKGLTGQHGVGSLRSRKGNDQRDHHQRARSDNQSSRVGHHSGA